MCLKMLKMLISYLLTIILLNLENNEKGPSLGHRKRRLDLRNAATSEQLVPMLEFVSAKMQQPDNHIDLLSKYMPIDGCV